LSSKKDFRSTVRWVMASLHSGDVRAEPTDTTM
jgi:hypothetical protein